MKSYVAAIRKEKIKYGKMSANLKKYIKDTKLEIKDENYSQAIEKLKLIYYILMIKYQGKQQIESLEINFKKLNRNELINERIKIEKELGRRHGFASDFIMNFILSSEIGLLTGLISGAFMSSDRLLEIIGQYLGLIFISVLFVLMIRWVIKQKKDLLYSLCLDAVNSLIDCIAE